MTWALIAFIIALAGVLGWLILASLFPRASFPLSCRIGLSCGLGLGMVTILQFILLYFSIKISPLSLISAISSILVLSSLRLLIKARKSGPAPKKIPPLSLVSSILLAFIIIQGSWVAIKSFNLPISSDDGTAIWGLKAKNIFYSNQAGTPLKELAAQMRFSLSGNYPLLVPLIENYTNLFCADWNDLYPKVIFVSYYFCLLTAFFGLMAKIVERNTAMIFVFFLATLPFLNDIVSEALADVPFTYYYITGFMLMLIWMLERENQYLYLSAVFLGLSAWAKNEGYPSLAINTAIILLFTAVQRRDQQRALFKGALGFLFILIPWILCILYYQSLTGIQEGIINKNTLSWARLSANFSRINYILYEIQRQLWGTPNRWNLLGYLFMISWLVNFKKTFKSILPYILLGIIFNFASTIIVYILSPQNLEYHLGTSLNRVLMHFIPLMLVFSAVILFSKNNNSKK